MPTEKKEENKGVHLINWEDLEILEKLGEGASGIIYKAKYMRHSTDDYLAVKLFKSGKTSDGLPEDEMKASEAAGNHPNSFEVLGRIINAPDKQLGLVMPLISNEYKILGGPPSFETITRDTFPVGKTFKLHIILKILKGISSICTHLHGRGICHGDLYAHNILINSEGHALLSDFGAASFYDRKRCIDGDGGGRPFNAMENIEVRAFGCLIQDLLDKIEAINLSESESDGINLNDESDDEYEEAKAHRKDAEAKAKGEDINPINLTEFGKNFLQNMRDKDMRLRLIQKLRVIQEECMQRDVINRPTFLSLN
eukprot:CAMPEP_0119040664 /NCGR_PEP_ID=MMETSP1177-20130426/10679_1 /TAXON_ID=2985 /ORGANISM="Ochromonas sp, Strain CCMP1899" /LENGTH=311 /DNA_ID=CAMNT_0007005959 /DNA_START=812 /DNA_END=1744 /DNA_ORIENTATION=-